MQKILTHHCTQFNVEIPYGNKEIIKLLNGQLKIYIYELDTELMELEIDRTLGLIQVVVCITNTTKKLICILLKKKYS